MANHPLRILVEAGGMARHCHWRADPGHGAAVAAVDGDAAAAGEGGPALVDRYCVDPWILKKQLD